MLERYRKGAGKASVLRSAGSSGLLAEYDYGVVIWSVPGRHRLLPDVQAAEVVLLEDMVTNVIECGDISTVRGVLTDRAIDRFIGTQAEHLLLSKNGHVLILAPVPREARRDQDRTAGAPRYS